VTTRECAYCADTFEVRPGRGGPARLYCGAGCKTAASVLRKTGHRTITAPLRRRFLAAA
jgi:hypothetical protein